MEIQDNTPDQELDDEKGRCLNCDKKMGKKARFCPSCGQKRGDGKVSMRDMLWKLWTTTFHLDNKLLRTIKLVWIPGELTLEYFSGRHKKYFHPIQLFLFTWVLLVLVFSLQLGSNQSRFTMFDVLGDDPPQYTLGRFDVLNGIRSQVDSLPEHLRNPEVQTTLDTLISGVDRRWNIRSGDSVRISAFLYDTSGHRLQVAANDLLHLPVDSMIKLYRIEGRFNQSVFRQTVQNGLNPEGVTRFWASTLSWALLFLMFVLTLWLQVLFGGSRRYSVEHFILMLHLHTGYFLFIALMRLCRYFLNIPKNMVFAGIILWMAVTAYISLKRYYQLGHRATTWRYCIFVFLYLFWAFVILICSAFLAFWMF